MIRYLKRLFNLEVHESEIIDKPIMIDVSFWKDSFINKFKSDLENHFDIEESNVINGALILTNKLSTPLKVSSNKQVCVVDEKGNNMHTLMLVFSFSNFCVFNLVGNQLNPFIQD